MLPMQRALTLIELLVVVAVIAILAAVALPNFLEAQTRARVARVQADYHAATVALEAYAADHARYPAYGHPLDYALFAGEPIVFLPSRLTTPVAYLTALPRDLFPGTRTGLAARTAAPYFYMHNYACEYLGKTQAEGHVQAHFRALTGSPRAVVWTVWCFGPDLDDDHGILLYDPTNGTLSDGDLQRFGP
jgi:prepilin-type N-terminal cleavage/methylation domain-containing protein